MPNEQKRQYVASLSSQFSKYPNFVLLNYGSTTHRDLEDLRHKIFELAKDKSPNISIIKNSLFQIAFKKYNSVRKIVLHDQQDYIVGEPLRGPSALLFMSDNWLDLLKMLYGFSKDREGVVFKAGIIDGQLYDSKKLAQLAQLPGFEELMTKLISSFKNSQLRMTTALQYNTSRFVYVLRQVKNS